MSPLRLPQIEVLIVDDEVPTRELLSEFRLVQGSHCRDQHSVGRRLGRGLAQARIVTTFGVGWVRVLTADRHSNASASVVTLTRHGGADSALRAVRESA